SRGTAAAAETWYTRSTAAAAVPPAAVVCARGARHQAAEVLQPGRGAAGLDHYAGRGRPGRPHHMTPAPPAPGCPAPARAGPVAQVRETVTRLLRDPPPRPGPIAAAIKGARRRKEEADIDHWHPRSGEYPPRRSKAPRKRAPPCGKGLQ